MEGARQARARQSWRVSASVDLDGRDTPAMTVERRVTGARLRRRPASAPGVFAAGSIAWELRATSLRAGVFQAVG